MSIKIDIVSDLHEDFWDNWGLGINWEPKSNYLIIAGDSANNPKKACDVVLSASKHYNNVMFTDGNHEHYNCVRKGATVEQNCAFLEGFSHSVENVNYLNGSLKILKGKVAVIGANGWYDFNAHPNLDREFQLIAWKDMSNDSRCIRFDSFPDKLAEKQAIRISGLAKACKDQGLKVVVVTHTAPHLEMLNRDHVGYKELDGAYYNSHMKSVWESGNVDVFVSGHTHVRREFESNGVKFYSNQRGYPNEIKGEFEIKQIEI